MTTHAKLSPSKRHRWAVCPGSIREEEKYPDSESGPAAVDGTHSHTLLEYCINFGLADPTLMVGISMKDDDGEFVIDADRADRVKVAIDYIRERYMCQWSLDPSAGCEIVAEKKVNPSFLLGRDDLSGTVDCQITGGDTLEIIDYKDGMGIVEAENNLQLEQYAYGALAELKRPIGTEYPFKMVRMTIIQPKLSIRGMSPISFWEVPVSHLLRKMGTLVVQAAATDKEDAPLVPGENQCRFCRAKGSCSALAGSVMNDLGVMLPATDAASSLDLVQQSAKKDPAVLSDDQLRQVMEAAPLMRQFLEGVEKEALRRIQSGQLIDGLKLVNGRGSRSWLLPEDEMAEKLTAMGLPKSAIYETKLVSPAKAEKLKWKKRDGTDVQLTQRQLDRIERDYVTKSAGKLTVVFESDSRAAVMTNAASMFSAVEVAPAADPLPSWLL